MGRNDPRGKRGCVCVSVDFWDVEMRVANFVELFFLELSLSKSLPQNSSWDLSC
jgi:hypothetical protein